MPSDQLIFIGFEVTQALSAQFAKVQPRDRVYLDDPNHLEMVQVDGRHYVGKRAEASAPIDRLEDAARSVYSLLTRLVPSGLGLKAGDALVLAAELEGKGAPLPEADPETDPEAFEYAALID